MITVTKTVPIQEQIIPAIRDGRDVLGIAQTGSGKTASYVLPVLMDVLESNFLLNRHIHTLVLVPTRELGSTGQCSLSVVGSQTSG